MAAITESSSLDLFVQSFRTISETDQAVCVGLALLVFILLAFTLIVTRR